MYDFSVDFSPPNSEHSFPSMFLCTQGAQKESTCRESQEGKKTIRNRESRGREEAMGFPSLASSPNYLQFFITGSCLS